MTSVRSELRKRNWSERPIEWLTGTDVFISYSHHDESSIGYAPALADQLQKKGLDCHLDQWGSQADKELPEFLKRIIRRSRVLVVLGSPSAYLSETIEEEIQIFKERHQAILPVDLDHGIRGARWWHELEGLTEEKEAENSKSAEPSERVVNRIVNSYRFIRARKRRAIGIVVAISLITLASIGLAGSLVVIFEATGQQASAELARDLAKAQEIGAVASRVASDADEDSVDLSLLLAAESFRRAPNIDAFVTIQRSLSLLPQPLSTRTIVRDLYDTSGIVLSRDGEYLLVPDHNEAGDQILQVLRTEDGDSVATLADISGNMPPTPFSSDGSVAVITVYDESDEPSGRRRRELMKRIRLANGESIGRGIQLERFWNCIAIGPRGATFAHNYQNRSEDTDKILHRSWDGDEDQNLIIPVNGECTGLAFSSDGRFLAVGSRQRQGEGRAISDSRYLLTVWGLEQQSLATNISVPGHIHYMTFDSEATRIAAVIERSLYVWSLSSEPTLAMPIIALQPDEDRIRFGQGDSDKIVLITQDALRVLDSRGRTIRQLAWPASTLMEAEIIDVSLASDELLVVLDSVGGFDDDGMEQLRNINVEEFSIDPTGAVTTLLEFDNYFDVLAMASFGTAVYLKTEDGIELLKIGGERTPVPLGFVPEAAALSPDEQSIVLCGELDNFFQLALVDIASAEVLWTESVAVPFQGEVDRISLSDMGDVAFTISMGAEEADDNVHVFGTQRGTSRSLQLGEPPPPDSYFWPGIPNWEPGVEGISADGERLILEDSSYLLATGITVDKPELDRMPGRAGRTALSKNGAYSAEAGQARIKIRSTRQDQQVAQINVDASLVTFSEDGRYVVAITRNAMKQWLFQRQDLLPMVKKVARRNLTEREQAEYIRDGDYVPLLEKSD